jgi:hypothetical protein
MIYFVVDPSQRYLIVIIYLFLTAIGLTPGGSSTAHIWLTPGGSSTAHIWLTPGGSSTAHHLEANSTQLF